MVGGSVARSILFNNITHVYICKVIATIKTFSRRWMLIIIHGTLTCHTFFSVQRFER
ncbi:hypothetical protein EG68_07743 [Paragonimus skrjabini miyazakii]|uniref:Uncharacterized protein n=1 Tax=Paragonimus skrjabini miyazakii TaxID=59628 RepID=A0A8S9YB66_9TREM|nr:hypothetical protein EG68_07743 [Paragonimus skrjabini miyazakii]